MRLENSIRPELIEAGFSLATSVTFLKSTTRPVRGRAIAVIYIPERFIAKGTAVVECH